MDSTQTMDGARAVRAPGRDLSAGRRGLGALLLTVAIGSAALLVAEHFQALALPGCGAGSPCERAARSVWGRVPLVQWPVSFLGLTYFTALLASWLSAPPAGVAPLLGWVARVGAAGSVLFLLVMVTGGYICWYCVICHVANLAFWGLLELTPRAVTPARAPVVVLGVVFAGMTVLLAAGDALGLRAVRERAESDLMTSTARIIAQGQESTLLPVGAGDVADPGAGGSDATGDGEPSLGAAYAQGFAGRYRIGPERAVVRLVLFVDYQCPSCKQTDVQVEALLADRDDICASFKHFPLNQDCNPSGEHKHSNACRAAKAAESAGLLRGVEGFWAIHRWMFERDGLFDDAALDEYLTSQGYDVAQFRAAMDGPEVADRLKADIEEARALGVYSTPVLYINGVELRGMLNAPEALYRAVGEIVAQGLPPRTAAEDHPAGAGARFAADWHEMPPRAAPRKALPWYRGPQDASVRVLLYGDYQDGQTAAAHQQIQDALEAHPLTRYEFRHLPINPDCNPTLRVAKYPLTCRASYAAEAAGRAGGAEAYWRVHDWLMTNQADFSEEKLLAAVGEMGLDPQRIHAAMDSADVQRAVSEDAVGSRRIGVDRIPVVFINDRWVPRWKVEGANVLGPILEEAARAAATQPRP
jgi:protein-disulfide isomerase